MKKLTIEEMHQIARKRKGKCLSSIYINSKTPLNWQCQKKHVWPAMPLNVKNKKSWCGTCAKNKKGTIEEMRLIANEKGGECLSKKYINANTHLSWKCVLDHKFQATPSKVKNRNQWCGRCNKKPKGTLSEMRKIAKKRGGKCLSGKYTNSKTQIIWQCKEKHPSWPAFPYDIKQGKWCPYCAGNIKGSIEEMQEIAKNRGGKCLSKEYTNNYTTLKWECAQKHRWSALPLSIKNHGTWCSLCSRGLGERICREFFKQLFKDKFPPSYPLWLVNNKGNKLELDGYSKSLGIAFEHQGRQHYKIPHHKIRTSKASQKILQHDKIKRVLCKKNEIKLFEIPEIPSLLPVIKVKSFIKEHSILLNVPIPKNFDSTKIDLKNAYIKKYLDDLKELALARGGKCLSKFYVDARTKLIWQCSEKHKPWHARPDNIKNLGQWCPTCKLKTLSEKTKKQWADPEGRKKLLKGLRKS
ncbi:MAG: hypothetical protein HN474_05190 [Nitrospina sp.]|nr:hypothetical protein [Nitrospina sp.]